MAARVLIYELTIPFKARKVKKLQEENSLVIFKPGLW